MFCAPKSSNPKNALLPPRGDALGLSKRCAAALSAAVLLTAPLGALAQDSGYFSGLRLSAPLSLASDAGPRSGAWSFASPGLKLGQGLEFLPPEQGSVAQATTTAFGGYRFGGGLSLAAAFSAAGAAMAAPLSSTEATSSGVGIRFDGARWADARSRSMNLDVVSAFSYGRALSVYGKLGVARGDARPSDALGVVSAERTAVSYGLGVRYDVTSSLGLKLELSRGTRLGLDRLRTESDPDSINFGLRWSF